MLGDIDLSDEYLLVNHLILIYKFYIYITIDTESFKHLKAIIDKTKKH